VTGALLWQVLIPTIPHRHELLCGLLGALDVQAAAGFGVLACRDNLQSGIAAKRQALLAASGAEYVSFVDDDDEVMPGFVALIMAALCERPDYIGFPVLYEVSGRTEIRTEHSIRYDGWHAWPEMLVRDISHLNPIRREIASLARFGGGYGEDARWADGIRDTGLVRTETWIPVPMYRYRFRPDDNAATDREPWPEPAIPPLPSYPWLEVLELP
jgi:glycosyltransferase involved in cell wall biosynthesis